jgi:hypothetical protein
MEKGMHPEEYDLVRVVRPFPEYNVPAGAVGTVVMVLEAEGRPSGYAVEFPESVPATEPWFVVEERDLEVVRRYKP